MGKIFRAFLLSLIIAVIVSLITTVLLIVNGASALAVLPGYSMFVAPMFNWPLIGPLMTLILTWSAIEVGLLTFVAVFLEWFIGLLFLILFLKGLGFK